MPTGLPPPFHRGESALTTYLKAGGFLLPASIFWLFACAFLLPKLKEIWSKAGLYETRINWILENTSYIVVGSLFGTVAVVLVVLLLEAFSTRWFRYRAAVIGTLTVAINAFVLAALTWITVLALLTAPQPGKKEAARRAPATITE